MTVPLIIKGRRGEHRSSVGGWRKAIRIENGNRRFRVSPTGDIGNYRFCTRVLIRIAVNIHRRTANGRPYGYRIFIDAVILIMEYLEKHRRI